MSKYFSVFSAFFLFFYSGLALANESLGYALIVDAGSTGSRIHLFEYNTESAVPKIRDIFSQSVRPGLSSYQDKPAQAGASLKPLLDAALQEMKSKQIDASKVGISVLATAGMRLVPEEKQQAIYSKVRQYIQTNYAFTVGETGTITGQMEGLYGWLDINYLLNTFSSKKDSTEGSIDMGGASTQIVFSTSDTSKPGDVIKLSIGNNTYNVYSKSFLGMGLMEALKYMNSQANAGSCYPAYYPMSDVEKGNFNFPVCSSIYNNLIQDKQVQQSIPALGKTHFIAYSGAFYTTEFFDLGENPTKAEYEGRVREVCSSTWEKLRADYPQEPEQNLSVYCANGTYLDQLLYNTYQLGDKQISVKGKINQQGIDWTLGALLYQIVSH